jgi:asparagine synthase (glutamine-hydrolysing)
MCGINGITQENESAIAQMAKATAHRGPDATGIFTAKGISFSHNRLSVIDLRDIANQPMHSPDKRFSLVYNGEIYNYRELRSELRSTWEFKTESDTEVLLAGYVRWGTDVLHKLKGIFAFGIYDGQEKTLLLARDQIGVKPMYYAIKDEVLYFSSELGGVIEATGYRTLSQQSFAYYVSLNYVPSPHTLVEGISKLAPAHMLTFKNKKAVIERYWNPEVPIHQWKSSSELCAVIGQGVKRQLVSDRPLGVFLSGGLDSSIVLHHAAQEIPHVRTFSVDFEMVTGAESEAEKFNSDALLAEKTAKIYGADHTTFTLTLDEVRHSFHSALVSLDEPIANPTSISQYLLSKWVREKGIVVALGGDGGDELFGGYTRHRIALGAYYFQTLPQFIQKSVSAIYPQAKKLSLPFGSPFHMQVLALKANKYKDLFSVTGVQQNVQNFFDEKYKEDTFQNLGSIDQFMRVDRETWLCDESLARTDRASMAFGVEARVPLLDIDVVAFADSIVGQNKFKPWSNKKILRDAYKGHLPEYLFNQPKRGWLSPGAKWLRDPIIHSYVREVLSSDYYSGLDTVVNWGAVQDMFTHHCQGGGYHLHPLWNILQLQVWAKKYSITV